MKIGLIGFGTIGQELFKRIQNDEGMEISFVFDIDKDILREINSSLVVESVERGLERNPDLVVEAAGFEAVKEYAKMVLHKCDFLILSSSALAFGETENMIKKVCARNNTKLYIPSGAIIGMDGIGAVKDELDELRIETKKNPKGFGRDDKEKTVLFDGSSREACKKFPKNVNVSATLSLNGIGLDKTKVKVISDPLLERNCHSIFAKGSFGEFEIHVRGVPSKNPKTSSLAAISAFDLIKRIKDGIGIY
ncbi:MAG: aspartate dehydrogenase [Candidatus Diapherotrites archaeon]